MDSKILKDAITRRIQKFSQDAPTRPSRLLDRDVIDGILTFRRQGGDVCIYKRPDGCVNIGFHPLSGRHAICTMTQIEVTKIIQYITT